MYEGDAGMFTKEFRNRAEVAEAWEGWVGSQTPAEFLRISAEMGHDTVERAVAAYIADLPNIFPEEAERIPSNLADILTAFIENYEPAAY